MLLTLNASCLRDRLLPSGSAPPALALTDLPHYTKDVLGLGGLNLSTDLLVGADRRRLENLRERADRAGCPCLLLIEAEPQRLVSDEPGVAEASIARMLRVLEAAQILACTAVALKVVAPDTDEALATLWPRLRKIVDRAERLEINLLISPHAGLTARPERVTDLIKKVGGFRIGTFPDFQSAYEATGSTEGAVTYLRRITPYASAVVASTLDFTDPAPGQPTSVAPGRAARPPAVDDADDDDDAPVRKASRGSPEPPSGEPKPKKKSAAKTARSEDDQPAPTAPAADEGSASKPRGKSVAKAVASEPADALPDEGLEVPGAKTPAKGARKGRAPKADVKADAKADPKASAGAAAKSQGKAADRADDPLDAKPSRKDAGKDPAGAAAAKPADDDDGDAGLEAMDDASLEDLIADILHSGEGDDAEPPEALPVHKPYDLYELVRAIASVGFDSTLAVDYRGPGDVTLGIRKSQKVLRAALEFAASADS